MKKWLLTAFIASSTAAVHAESPFDGLCGEELFNAVRASYSVSHIPGAEKVWQNIRLCDGDGAGFINNIFSAEPIPFPHNTLSPENGALFYVVDSSYWGSAVLPFNLSNIFPAPVSETEKRADYPAICGAADSPYSTVKYSNGTWGTANYTLSPGYDINCYMPPKGYEGDFARITLMMVTLYPCNSWSGKGNNIFAENKFPVFQQYYLRDLLQMNISDPVDAREESRNSIISGIQGKGNPFVDYPQLAEHIWGAKNSEPFASETGVSRTPVKPKYTAEDKFFHCFSPYLPGKVEWFVFNNQKYDGDAPAPLEGVAPGCYTVYYGSGRFSGSLIIEIVK